MTRQRLLILCALGFANAAACFSPTESPSAPSGSDDAGTEIPADAAEIPADAASIAPDAGTDAGGGADAATGDVGYPGYVTGSTCNTAANCMAQNSGIGACLKPTDGFPNGYCTGTCKTSVSNSCDPGTFCVDFTPKDTKDDGACFKGCTQDSDCRQGYVCDSQLTTLKLAQKACIPGKRGAALGDPCADQSACAPGDICMPESAVGFPGGYCTRGCDVNKPNDCGGTNVCHDFDPGKPTSQAVCLKGCTADTECRPQGYVCDTKVLAQTLPSKACVAGTRAAVAIGAACASSGDCSVGQLCAQESTTSFPGGYCTASCMQDTDCGGDAHCIVLEAGKPGLCLDGCTQDADCRGGGRYACSAHAFSKDLPNGQKACIAFQPSAKIGDACKNAPDCTKGGVCFTDDPNTGKTFRGGYCTDSCSTTPIDTCGVGAFCIAKTGSTSGLCLDQCAMTSECRVNEGYLCAQPPGSALNKACLPF